MNYPDVDEFTKKINYLPLYVNHRGPLALGGFSDNQLERHPNVQAFYGKIKL